MKKLLMLSLMALTLTITGLEAGTIVFNPGSTVYTNQQPITAIFTDSNGNTYEQTVYYNSTIGGVDIGNPDSYVSVYFPTVGNAYLWNNGFWVGQDGYYWNNGTRIYVGPGWNDHWNAYWGPRGWHGGGYYGRGGWGRYDVHVNNYYERNNWHGNDWHGGRDWHEDNWRGGDWHGSEHGGEWRGSERGSDWRSGERGGGEWGGRERGGEWHGGDRAGRGGEGRRGGGGGHRR